jgi:hypothetical protein
MRWGVGWGLFIQSRHDFRLSLREGFVHVISIL